MAHSTLKNHEFFQTLDLDPELMPFKCGIEGCKERFLYKRDLSSHMGRCSHSKTQVSFIRTSVCKHSSNIGELSCNMCHFAYSKRNRTGNSSSNINKKDLPKTGNLTSSECVTASQSTSTGTRDANKTLGSQDSLIANSDCSIKQSTDAQQGKVKVTIVPGTLTENKAESASCSDSTLRNKAYKQTRQHLLNTLTEIDSEKMPYKCDNRDCKKGFLFRKELKAHKEECGAKATEKEPSKRQKTKLKHADEESKSRSSSGPKRRKTSLKDTETFEQSLSKNSTVTRKQKTKLKDKGEESITKSSSFTQRQKVKVKDTEQHSKSKINDVNKRQKTLSKDIEQQSKAKTRKVPRSHSSLKCFKSTRNGIKSKEKKVQKSQGENSRKSTGPARKGKPSAYGSPRKSRKRKAGNCSIDDPIGISRKTRRFRDMNDSDDSTCSDIKIEIEMPEDPEVPDYVSTYSYEGHQSGLESHGPQDSFYIAPGDIVTAYIKQEPAGPCFEEQPCDLYDPESIKKEEIEPFSNSDTESLHEDKVDSDLKVKPCHLYKHESLNKDKTESLNKDITEPNLKVKPCRLYKHESFTEDKTESLNKDIAEPDFKLKPCLHKCESLNEVETEPCDDDEMEFLVENNESNSMFILKIENTLDNKNSQLHIKQE